MIYGVNVNIVFCTMIFQLGVEVKLVDRASAFTLGELSRPRPKLVRGDVPNDDFEATSGNQSLPGGFWKEDEIQLSLFSHCIDC